MVFCFFPVLVIFLTAYATFVVAFDDVSILTAAKDRGCTPTIKEIRYHLLGDKKSFFEGKVYSGLMEDEYLLKVPATVWRYRYEENYTADAADEVHKVGLCISMTSVPECAEMIDLTTRGMAEEEVSARKTDSEHEPLAEIEVLNVVVTDSVKGGNPSWIEDAVMDIQYMMKDENGFALYYADPEDIEMYRNFVSKADSALGSTVSRAMVFFAPRLDVIPSLDHDLKAASCLEGTTFLQMLHLQDLSRSFKNDLPNIKKQMPQIVSDLVLDFSAVEVSLATFIDRPKEPFGGRRDYCYKEHHQFSSDLATHLDRLNELYVRSGLDWKEAQLFAMKSAADSKSVLWYEQGFPGVTFNKVVIVVTDSGYHTYNEKLPRDDCFYPEIAEVADSFSKQSLSVIFLVTRDVEKLYVSLLEQLDIPGEVRRIGSKSDDFDVQLLHALRKLRNVD